MFPEFTGSLPGWLTSAPPALIVLVAALFIEMVSWIGFTLISEQLFAVYRWIRYRKDYSTQATLKHDIVQLRRDLKSTSSMDEFAKWARIRRQVDGKAAEYEKLTSSLRIARTFFLIKAQIGTRALFYLLYVVVWYMYSSVAMFYIPEDWFGSLVGSMMALPWAPTGSVSVMIWMLACRKVCRNAMELAFGNLEGIPESSDDDELKEE